MHSQIFSHEIQCQATFIVNFFDAKRIFGSVEPQTEPIFPFLYIIIFQRWESFEPLVPLQGQIDICARGLFCTKFNFEQLLFKAFFYAMRIFGIVERQTNLIFYLST